MSNYYDNKLNANENDQYRSNNGNGASRVVEIPVIHCPSSNNQQQQPQPQVQQQQPHHQHHHHHPQYHTQFQPNTNRYYQQPQYSVFDQPTLIDDFTVPLDYIDSNFTGLPSLRSRLQDPNSTFDDFFSRSPFDQDYFLDRASPSLLNSHPHFSQRLGSKSPLSGSPKNSPKLSPRFDRSSQTPPRTSSTTEPPPPPSAQSSGTPPPQPQPSTQQHETTPTKIPQSSSSYSIPVNYIKQDNNIPEKSPKPSSFTPKFQPTADIPFQTYSSSPKTEQPSLADQLANYRKQQQERQRSPAPPPPPLHTQPQPQQQPKPQPQPPTQTQSQTSEATRRSPSPNKTNTNTSSSNMGGTNQKQQHLPSDFIKLATDAVNMNTPPRSTTPVKVVKTSQEKIDDINARLDSLEKDVDAYTGVEGKKDKQFLLLEEHLTQCLLRLDEIDRDNDDINKQRRKLISRTQSICDKLERKINLKHDEDEENNSKDETAVAIKGFTKIAEAATNDNNNKSNENNNKTATTSNNNNNNDDNNLDDSAIAKTDL